MVTDHYNPYGARADWEAEKAVLSLVVAAQSHAINEDAGVDIVADFALRITPDHFTKAPFQWLYGLLFDRIASGESVDCVSLTPVFNANRDDWADSKDDVMSVLVSCIHTEAWGWNHWCDRLDLALRNRNTQKVAKALEEKADGSGVNENDVMEAMAMLSTGKQDRARGRVVSVQKALVELVAHLEEVQEGKAEKGIPTGIDKIDEMTLGMKRGHYWVIGARTSIGKTSALISLSRQALTGGFRVVFVTLEMQSSRVVQRYLSQISEVSVNRMERQGEIGREKRDIPRIMTASQTLDKSRMQIIEPDSRSIHDLVRKVTREHKREPIDLLVVDYLQKIKDPSVGKNSGRQVELANVSAELQAIAKDLNFCVLTAAQLNRGADGTAPPKLSDFRECGDIEQDADVVALLHRPNREDQADRKEEDAEVIIAKNRDGMTGVVECLFRKPTMEWATYAEPMGDF